MKILYASDVHSDFENLKRYRDFATGKEPDLTVVSGDLIDFGYKGERDMAEHAQLLEPMLKMTEAELKRRNRLGIISSPAELFNCAPIIAEQVLEGGAMYPDEWKELAEAYLKSLDKAIDLMGMQYSIIKDLFSGFGDKVAFLPGNYDPDLENTPLKEGDLHGKVGEISGFRIAGYGGAGTPKGMPLGPMSVPIELSVPFNEMMHEEGMMSQPYQFLAEAKPDIILAHAPPFKYLDEVVVDEEGEKVAHCGSPGFHKYVSEDGEAELFLCGHNHRPGAAKVRRPDRFTAVINAGSLKKEEGGRFLEVELDDETKKLVSATQYGTMPLGGFVIEAKHIRTDDNSLTSMALNHVLEE